jgi:hypothetical protein
MFMIYLYTKFHIPSSTGSLVTSMKSKDEENDCITNILLFYILIKYYANSTSTFFQDLLPYIIQYHIVSDDSVTPLS